jgi:glycerol-3-phosphate acyltransferase PlsY
VIGPLIANIALGYLLGSIPVGLIVGRIWLGRDIRQSGSGSTGTTNVLRNAGKVAAVVALLGDLTKGLLPALIGRYFWDDDLVASAGAMAAVTGHVWPVFAGFRGGKGVATTYGGILGLTPLLSLLFPLVGLVLVVPTRYVSLMSVVGVPVCAAVLVVLAATGWQPWPFALYAVFAVVIVEYKHVANIRRLLSGVEPKIGQGGDRSRAH